MKKQFLETGKIVGTHGIRGEMRVNPWADSPEFICDFKTIYLDAEGREKLYVERARVHKNIVILKVKDIDSIESAENYRNRVIYINRDDVTTDSDEWFIVDLIGAEVFDTDTKEKIGVICDVSQTGANDVWHIKSDEKIYLIPAIESVVIDVDIESSKVEIRLLEGIFDI